MLHAAAGLRTCIFLLILEWERPSYKARLLRCFQRNLCHVFVSPGSLGGSGAPFSSLVLTLEDPGRGRWAASPWSRVCRPVSWGAHEGLCKPSRLHSGEGVRCVFCTCRSLFHFMKITVQQPPQIIIHLYAFLLLICLRQLNFRWSQRP